MSEISMHRICKSFDRHKVLDEVNLEVEKGEIHCLLGENGAGKTTLMNILYGLYHADSGETYIKGKQVNISSPKVAQQHHIGMVHQHFMLIESMTVLQNIILGNEEGKFSIDYARSRDKVLDMERTYHFNFDLDKPISALSVGEKQRVEIFKAIYRGADIIVLDEPTAVLTPQEVEVLFHILDDMRAQQKTIIFITHKLYETMELSNSVTVLRNGKVVQTLRTKDATSQLLATMMVGHEVSFDIKKTPCRPGETVLDLKNLRVLPVADPQGISLKLHKGEIYGIAGVDGNGQQELESCIIGTSRPISGSIFFDGKEITNLSVSERKMRGIAAIPSDRLRNAILPDMSIVDNYLLGFQHHQKFAKYGFLGLNALRNHAAKMIEAYSIKVSSLTQPISQLSGGNQQKIVFSREAGLEPLLLIAAQPVRGLDIGAIDAIHRQLLELRDSGKAILLISTELSEIMEMSDRIGVLYKGNVIAERDADKFTIRELGLFMAGQKAS